MPALLGEEVPRRVRERGQDDEAERERGHGALGRGWTTTLRTTRLVMGEAGLWIGCFEKIGRRAEFNPRSERFSTYLSRLRSLELIEGRDQGRASAELCG